jgi:AcrR family transcriptional regulator
LPAPLLPKDEVLGRLFGVFRTYGYEGATLARISQSTGLGRASLYHYFPGGKDQMAREVLGVAGAWLGQNVVAPLQGAGSIQARVKAMIANLRAGYADGEASCVINLLGVGEADEKFHAQLNETVELWLHAFERTLRDAGVTPARARRSAVDALVRIEGSLVVARALGDKSVFIRTLSELERDLIEVAQHA